MSLKWTEELAKQLRNVITSTKALECVKNSFMEAAEEIKTISKQLENAKGYVKVNFNHRCCGGQENLLILS